jgi:hypothetical protein
MLAHVCDKMMTLYSRQRNDAYGKSPMAITLADIKFFESLPDDVKAYNRALFAESRFQLFDDDDSASRFGGTRFRPTLSIPDNGGR